MLNLKIVGASLLLGASSVALAQETEDEHTSGIGQTVSDLAKGGMPTTDPEGFAAAVQALAKAQGSGDDEEELETEDVETSDQEDDVEGQNSDRGSAVSAKAQAIKDSENKLEAVQDLLLETPAAQQAHDALGRAAAARSAGAAAAAEARGAASANRADVTQIRAQAAAARSEAQAAASTARNVRDTVRAARPGRGGN